MLSCSPSGPGSPAGAGRHRKAARPNTPEAKVAIAAALKTNKVCLECHMDFEAEAIVVRHQEAGISCVRCHGVSLAHMEDEVRATKADVTFKGAQEILFCLTCHDWWGFPKVAEHRGELAKPPAKQRTCTSCHGEHELVDMELLKPGGS